MINFAVMAKKIDFKSLILWENQDYLVVNKPPFISTLDDRNDEVNMLSMARKEFEDIQVCHRLDKETSGVLIFAKNPDAYRELSIQFENRTVNKLYHAVVDGIHSFNKEEVDAPILKLGNGTVRIDRKGKESKTFFQTIRAFKMHTLIECKPVSGRMHQIRIHLSKLSAAITGDTQYGGKPFFLSKVKKGYNLKKWEEEKPLINRFALHAAFIEFDLLDKTSLRIEAPYPKDFRALLKQLENNN